MFAEQGRALHLGRAIRHLDGIADREVFAALGMIDLDHGAGGAQRLIFGELLHRQDRPAGDVVPVENLHRLEFGLRHGPLLDAREDFVEPRQARRRLGVIGMGLPAGLADDIANLLPHWRLGDEADVGVGIGLPALALQNPARLAAPGIITPPRHRFAEWNAPTILPVFFHRAVGEALLVAQFYTRKIQYAVLHRRRDLLPLAGHGALIERGDDAEREMPAR